MTKKERKEPFGRPTKYKKEYCEMLIDLMGKGYSFEAFAGYIEVNKTTLYEWEKKHSDFSNAKSIGIEKARYFYETKSIDHLIEKPHGNKLNNTNWVFNMKNRFGWVDKHEISGHDGGEIKLSYNVNSESN